MRWRKRRSCSSSLTENQYFTSMIPEWISISSNSGHECRNSRYSSSVQKPMTCSTPGAVVPGPVEEHDLAARRQVRGVALEVPLRLLLLGRGAERGDAHDARIGALHDPLDRAALPRRVAPLEEDAHLQAFVAYPLLELHQLPLQPRQVLLVRVGRERRRRRLRVVRRHRRNRRAHDHATHPTHRATITLPRSRCDGRSRRRRGGRGSARPAGRPCRCSAGHRRAGAG